MILVGTKNTHRSGPQEQAALVALHKEVQQKRIVSIHRSYPERLLAKQQQDNTKHTPIPLTCLKPLVQVLSSHPSLLHFSLVLSLTVIPPVQIHRSPGFSMHLCTLCPSGSEKDPNESLSLHTFFIRLKKYFVLSTRVESDGEDRQESNTHANKLRKRNRISEYRTKGMHASLGDVTRLSREM